MLYNKSLIFSSTFYCSLTTLSSSRWAENRTGSKIYNFLQEGLLREKQSAILIPGVIQSLWLNDFDPNNTFQKGLFYRTADDRYLQYIYLGL